MLKKTFSFLVLTLCCVGNLWAQIAIPNNLWKSGQDLNSGTYYLYNIGANRYMGQGSRWDTHAVLDGAGLQFTVSKNNDVYTLQQSSDHPGYLYYTTDATPGIFIDGGSTNFKFNSAGNWGGFTNCFTISFERNGTTWYLGWAGGGGDQTDGQLLNEVRVTDTTPNTSDYLWMLISPDDREFDYTYRIKNPDFERGYSGNPTTWSRQTWNGWTNTNNRFRLEITPQPFTNATFAETWKASAGVDAGTLSQTISDLPAGTYILTVTGQAINETNGNSPCTYGVNLFLGNNKTLIGAAGTYQVTTELPNGGSLELGVEVLNGNNANWVAFDNVRLYRIAPTTSSSVSFNPTSTTTRLIDLNVVEPTLPAGATALSYSSSNTKIAKVDNTGDVMVVNTGLTTISAVVLYNGKTYNASYSLTVEAGAATYEISGNTYTLKYVYSDGDDAIVPHPDGSGKLLDRVVTGIPQITMEFGNVGESDPNNRNQTIVRNEPNIGLVATTLDSNGWRNLWWTDDNGHTKPYQGTFYTFKPVADGELTISGYLSNENINSSLVDATDNYRQVASITTSSRTQMVTTTVNLTAGHTYYLYGNIRKGDGTQTEHCTATTEQWSVYQLRSFTFNSVFQYAQKSVILTHDQINSGTNQYLQTLNATGASYSAEFKGNLTGDCNTTTGEVTNISGDGGAIVVTATLGGISTYYVITVPYISKTWSFNKSEDDAVQLKINKDSNLAMYYKVRKYNEQTRNLEELTKPVISVNQSLDGDNAHFIGSTAGLIITGNAKSFGCDASVVNLYAQGTPELQADVEWVDAQLRTMLNYHYPSDDVTGEDRLTMNKGVTLTIPGLKAGQHVAIEWNHHLNGSLGDSFTVTNAKDLDGNVIPESQQLKVGATRRINTAGNLETDGLEEFIVAADGPFSFNITDNGWVDIYKIIISDVDVDIPSEIILSNNISESNFDGNNRILSHDGNGKSNAIRFSRGDGHSASRTVMGLGVYHSIDETVGTINCTLDVQDAYTYLNINSGRGLIKVVTRVKSNGYTLDKRENWIPINIEKLTTFSYPHTWDFQNMYSYIESQMNNGVNNNIFWKKNADGETYDYQTHTGNTSEDAYGCRLFNNNAAYQLYANDAVIPDAEGIGFGSNSNAITSKRNNFIHINRNGLLVGADRNHLVKIPSVGSDQYVYIRTSGSEGNVSNAVQNGTNYTPYKTIDGDRVYRFQGTGGDFQVYMGGVTIKQIGVTGITKTLYDGYATESRDIAIDHSLTNVFTGDDVVAQYVSFNSYDRNTASVTFSDVPTTTTRDDEATHQVVPANTGVVLKCEGKFNEQEPSSVPFFVPAMHTVSSEISGNMLAANVEGGDLSETMNIDGTNYTPFIFTKTYYKYSQKDGWDPNPSTADQYGYYRLAAKYGTYMSPNKSYLLVPGLDAALWAQSGNVKGVTILNLDDTALSIGNVASPMEPDVFYNMSGSKVTTPTQPGVYIFNGKKVMVK